MRPEIETLLTDLENPANTHLLDKLEQIIRPHEQAEVRLRLGRIAARLRREAQRDHREANALAAYGTQHGKA
ncbi:hypothetical protein [Methylocystis echinoides]|uniref:Uncharacterized protein n=1 Tax=Methylocystis echinoides TaxID=29468 RepID=A0A9W6GVL3_9HYPH|nr:hypothetical protein [Methylocystis echinoides]GLI93675.1 hypothetical protein LMG27198_26670 [Methylocystis echinoides]